MIAAYSGGQSMLVIRYFICASNIVETPFTSDVGNNTRSHCTKRLWYTVHYPTHGIFGYPKSISNHLTVGSCRCLPQPHRTCINGVSDILGLLAKTMCERTQLTMPRAEPEKGAGVQTPAPWKITNSIGLYRNMQLDPLHLGKVGPPGNVRAPFSMEYRKVIV